MTTIPAFRKKSEVEVVTSNPSNPFNGQSIYRFDLRHTFVYNADLGLWLGDEIPGGNFRISGNASNNEWWRTIGNAAVSNGRGWQVDGHAWLDKILFSSSNSFNENHTLFNKGVAINTLTNFNITASNPGGLSLPVRDFEYPVGRDLSTVTGDSTFHLTGRKITSSDASSNMIIRLVARRLAK